MWNGPDGPLRSSSIITTTPNEFVEDVHDRMPVILPSKIIDP
ncbi:SOS response-associated peptidase family protein [Cohnella sp. GCM10012308]